MTDKKRGLGKINGVIQLSIGIILLLIGIYGIILVNNYVQEMRETGKTISYNKEAMDYLTTNESRLIYTQIAISFMLNWEREIMTAYYSLLMSTALIIIISILFITQGLVNLSSKEK